MTPEKYFREWRNDNRTFTDYKSIHSHRDMMRFANDYYNEQLRLKDIDRVLPDDFWYYNEYGHRVNVLGVVKDFAVLQNETTEDTYVVELEYVVNIFNESNVNDEG